MLESSGEKRGRVDFFIYPPIVVPAVSVQDTRNEPTVLLRPSITVVAIWMERRRRRASLLSGPTAHLFLCRSFPFPFPRFTTDSTCHHHDSLNNNSSSLPLKNKVSKSGASLAVRHWLEKSERLVSRWAERSAVTRSRPNSSLEASHVHTFSWYTAGGKKNKEDRNTCY